MSNLEHLVENGLVKLEKGITYKDWMKQMAKDTNWNPWVSINIDDLWEICQYVKYTYMPESMLETYE